MALLGLTQVLYAFIVDVAVFQTSFTAAQLIGALIILIFNIIVIVTKI